MQDNWLNKIRNHQTPPPPEAWLNITNELDKEKKNTNEELTTKILAYETAPPANALNNIFNQMDEAEESTATPFVEKIKNYTQAAPVAAWQNIIGKLDKEENVIQLYSNKKKINAFYLRIAVAAAVIAIVWITIILNNKKSAADNNLVKITPKKTENALPTTTAIDTVTPAIPMPQKANLAAAPTRKMVTVKYLSTTPTDYIKGNNVQDLAQSPAINKKGKLQNANGQTPTDIALLNTPNTYVSIIGADGQSVKISSKFSNLIAAFSNNPEIKENIDIIIDESAKWRPIIDRWKNKMTNNSVAPSLSNFMDIIALSEVLEEKK